MQSGCNENQESDNDEDQDSDNHEDQDSDDDEDQDSDDDENQDSDDDADQDSDGDSNNEEARKEDENMEEWLRRCTLLSRPTHLGRPRKRRWVSVIEIEAIEVQSV